VGDRLATLQDQVLTGVPAARAMLAELRRGVGHPAGSIPAIWEVTVGLLPELLQGRGDAPSRAETAAHEALTLYALHQQGKSQAMHVPKVGLGTAVQRLRQSEQRSSEAVDRRFLALATATDLPELAFHLRGLATQLRAAEIGLDYGQLAGDLYDLTSRGRDVTVRLRWGRQLHARSVAHDPSTADTSGKPVDSRKGAVS